MENGHPERRRDIVVVGASAGGVEALRAVVAGLPAGYRGAVFVVLHVSPDASSVLGDILDRAGPLPAAAARDGERVRPGRVYVAPPDHHLTVLDGHVRLDRGPRENGHRPAVDRLFRSAADDFGPRVAGVVLSGAGDDGTAGLRRIEASGGAVIVQELGDALYPSMPESALAAVQAAEVCGAQDVGPRLAELITTADTGGEMSAEDPHPSELEDEGPQPGVLNQASGLRCPDCGGSLWERRRDGLVRYECRVGHTYSVESMVRDQGLALESLLYSAQAALEERADLLRRVARRMQKGGNELSAASFHRKADAVAEQARRLGELLAAGPGEVPPGPEEIASA